MQSSKALTVFIIIGAIFMLSDTCAASMGCFYDRNPDIVTCPPANGGIAADTKVNFVCGIGWCAEDVNGKIKCSKVPGGAAISDQNGNVICTGGCMDAIPSLCQRIELPKFIR